MSPEELLDLAESDPRRALIEADEVLRGSDRSDRVLALRAKGIAYRTLGDISASIQELEQGLSEAETDGNQLLQGQMEMTLAPSLAYAGDMERAFELLLSAEGRLDESGRAQALTQRAGLVARTGDFSTCLELFSEAEPILLKNKDERWLANLSANRGLVHVYSGSFDLAEADLLRAQDLYVKRGETSSAAEMTHNLGFLAMQRGDIGTALQAYDRAEESFTELGIPLHELMLDRAGALLLVGLASDAQAVTAAVVKGLEGTDQEIIRGEALVAHSNTSLVANDYSTAIESAAAAMSLLQSQDRPGWRSRAQYLRLTAESANGSPVKPRQFMALAEDLKRSGQTLQSLHAHLLAGRRALANDDIETASSEFTLAGTPPAHSPVDIRIQATLATALLRQGVGDERGAGAAVREGVRLLDEYRSTLGATESRVNVARHATELFELGMDLALLSGRPSRVLSWIGRSRSGSLRLVSPTPPQDAEYADALTRLRMAQAERHDSEMSGEHNPELLRQQTRLEQEIRRIALRQKADGSRAHSPVPLADLQQRLGDRTMVVFGEANDEVFGIRVRRASIAMKTLGPASEIRREADHLQHSMRMLAIRPDARTSPSMAASIERSAAEVDARLFQPFRLKKEALVIIPSPTLHSLAWAALPTLDNRSFVISPSPYVWHHQARPTGRKESAVLVGGPRLQNATVEIETLAELYPNATVLKGLDATVDSALGALEDADIAHFACHASFRSDNAMFSSLELADGDLTVYDIERLGKAPATVVLSACDSGLSENFAGEELMGFATALTSLGTTSLVASVAFIPDADPTIHLMSLLHKGVSKGLAPADALAEARQGLVDEGPVASVTRKAFFCMGS